MSSIVPVPCNAKTDFLSCEEESSEIEEGGVAAEVEVRNLRMGAEQHAQRLDRALTDSVREFSRNYLQQLLALGAVTVNGSTVTKPAQRVKAGDRVSVEMRPTVQSQAFRPEPMALNIVYEDAYLLVVNKPAGLVVHPAPGNWSGTLLNGLLDRYIGAVEVPRAGIVHRLDKDTSGLMVVARNRATMDALVRLIADRHVTRQYLALAHHPWRGSAKQTVEAPIGRDPRNRLRMAVVDLAVHSGKTAKTDIELLSGTAIGCLVQCSLHTGRTHQIRVHMASIGHPLVADPLYGGATAGGMQRQALHAFRLAFIHPMTGQEMEFHAPLPSDFSEALVQWGVSLS